MPSVVKFGKLLDDTTSICIGPDVDTMREQMSHDLSLLSSSSPAIFVDGNQL